MVAKYKTTKDLLYRFLIVERIINARSGATIYGKVNDEPFKHQFGPGSGAEKSLLAIRAEEFPVMVKFIRVGRCLDIIRI